MHKPSAIFLLNLAHAVDHTFLLIFATAVASIAATRASATGRILFNFTDAMMVRYVDDHVRSRVAGMRLAVSIGIGSLAVWALGPLVKGMGFDNVLLLLAGVALCTAFAVLWLPSDRPVPAPVPA